MCVRGYPHCKKATRALWVACMQREGPVLSPGSLCDLLVRCAPLAKRKPCVVEGVPRTVIVCSAVAGNSGGAADVLSASKASGD